MGLCKSKVKKRNYNILLLNTFFSHNILQPFFPRLLTRVSMSHPKHKSPPYTKCQYWIRAHYPLVNIQQSCALYENNNGFPRLLTPRELSRSVVSNVLRRRPQSSCVCVHICLATWILALQWTHLLYCAIAIVLFLLSSQPQFSLSFTCKLLNDLLCTICKIGHAYGRQNP